MVPVRSVAVCRDELKAIDGVVLISMHVPDERGVAVAIRPVNANQITSTDVADVDCVAKIKKYCRESGVVALLPTVAAKLLLPRGDDRRRVWHVRVDLEIKAIV